MSASAPARDASLTADASALTKACHLLYDPAPHIHADRFALPLLSPRMQAIARDPAQAEQYFRVRLAGLEPLVGETLARHAFAEAHADAAYGRGIRQHVLVGAGLDSYALRRAGEPADLRFFEIDHPASQAVKRDRLAAIGRADAPIEFVPVDFERDTLDAGLRRSRFDPARPAFFAWLGVVVYLSPEATRQTLAAIAAVAAPGSEVTFDFFQPPEILREEDARSLRLSDAFGRERGEPNIGYHRREEMIAIAAGLGYEVAELLPGTQVTARHVPAHLSRYAIHDGVQMILLRRP
ncbi:MAG: class I SAM-dependent methyltransferase [Gammaproteobacteria bacterium]